MKDLENKILSDIIVHMKYAKWIPELSRRENWTEIVDRNKNMHLQHYPWLSEQIENAYEYVYNREVLPSMRSMQFGGPAIEVAHNRMYNCAFMPVDSYEAFSEAMFLLLGGTGVGYSVQRYNIEQLPAKKREFRGTKQFTIPDDIEGWADSIKACIKNNMDGYNTVFDYSSIRPKGTLLKTSGGRAPGPKPLEVCLDNIALLLDSRVKPGDKMTSLDAHDIMCHLSNAVLAGGIRRAAMISLFDYDDEEMLTCKSGEWWKTDPHRGRANNSVILHRASTDETLFSSIWDKVKTSNAGEPGFYFTNDITWGTNPCCEIALKPYQFCNLVEINASDVVNQKQFDDRVVAATIIATLQAGYTGFHYLRPMWKETTEEDALIGVSMTGIASGNVTNLDMSSASNLVKKVNAEFANLIGINPAARTTCVKPAGTTSLTLGTSSGIHAWHNDYYIRRVRVSKSEPIYNYLNTMHPELIEDDNEKPETEAIISVPQRAPVGATLRHESALNLLQRVKLVSNDWIHGGHKNGANTHNVSATISIRDDEWGDVRKWMWENRGYYNGLSVLPYSGGSYKQAPFEDCTKQVYESLIGSLVEVDLNNVFEDEDGTDLMGEIACAGGACEIK